MTRAGSADSGTVIDQITGGGAIPTSALHIRKIPWSDARGFLIENHYLHRVGVGVRLSLGVFASSAFGAQMIGVMTFSLPVAANRLKDGFISLELTRMCIADVTTRNAESRCLAVAARIIRQTFPEIRHLIAYSDLEGRGHKGTIYAAAGWVCEGGAGNLTWTNRPGRRDRGSNTRKLRWRKTLAPSSETG